LTPQVSPECGIFVCAPYPTSLKLVKYKQQIKRYYEQYMTNYVFYKKQLMAHISRWALAKISQGSRRALHFL
jgi:hypothetical protein